MIQKSSKVRVLSLGSGAATAALAASAFIASGPLPTEATAQTTSSSWVAQANKVCRAREKAINVIAADFNKQFEAIKEDEEKLLKLASDFYIKIGTKTLTYDDRFDKIVVPKAHKKSFKYFIKLDRGLGSNIYDIGRLFAQPQTDEVEKKIEAKLNKLADLTKRADKSAASLGLTDCISAQNG